MQIKEVLGSDFERTKNLNHIWKSESTNSDGDYYYYVLSYDTFENIIDASGNGRYEYSLGYDNQVIGSTKPIKMYLFNVSNRSVSVNFDYKLGRVIRNDNSHSGTNDNYVIYPADSEFMFNLTMSGFPVPMEPVDTTTIQDYSILKSVNQYDGNFNITI